MTTHVIERTGDTLVVRLHHRLTHRATAQFHEVLARLENSPVRHCDMHLDSLDFIDSQGLGLLLTAGRIAQDRAMGLRLVSPRGEVKERLEFVRMGEVVEIAY
ncbi:STAS domain-containing protein [Roseospira goensis]|uniref:Anti-anti-sigma factor n=1 Tax=Roseospira goensis TaxID=391922 RepID=A0A7W6S354_9PROT|nr:STAS domain-containing protein [Roseospira goensis]MBB4287337.1 anti-anti-sigma factor [Roseospira goensis]